MSNMRNDFTDALNEEITARKILDKAKTQTVEDKIFLSEVTEEIAEPEIKKSVEPPKFSSEKNIPPVEKISLEKKPAPKKIIITKADFEKRVFAEADNDFYDDIKSKVADKKDMPPVFHSKKFDDTPSELDEKISVESDFDVNIKLNRIERIGIILSAVMLVYGFATLDKSLIFMAMSLLTGLLRPVVGKMSGKHNRAVQNAMRSFSIVLFFGAILFIFT